MMVLIPNLSCGFEDTTQLILTVIEKIKIKRFPTASSLLGMLWVSFKSVTNLDEKSQQPFFSQDSLVQAMAVKTHRVLIPEIILVDSFHQIPSSIPTC